MKNLKAFVTFFKGKKTFFVAAAMFVVGGLEATQVISIDVASNLKTFLLGAGMATLKLGQVNK